jgi:hypothetical protein
MLRSILITNGINGNFGQPQSITLPQLGTILAVELAVKSGEMTAAQFSYVRIYLEGKIKDDLSGTDWDQTNQIDSIPAFATDSVLTLPMMTPGLLSPNEAMASAIPLDGVHQKNFYIEWLGVSAPPAVDPVFELTVLYDDKYNAKLDKGKMVRRLTKLDTLVAGSAPTETTKLIYGNAENRFIKRVAMKSGTAVIDSVKVEFGKDKLRVFERNTSSNNQIIGQFGAVVGKVVGAYYNFIIDNGETGRPRYWDTSKFQIGDQNVNIQTFCPNTGGVCSFVEETYGDRTPIQ